MKRTPKNGALVQTPEGKGVVVEQNLLTGILKVRLDKEPEVAPKVFKASQVRLIKDAKIKVEKDEMEQLKDLEG